MDPVTITTLRLTSLPLTSGEAGARSFVVHVDERAGTVSVDPAAS